MFLGSACPPPPNTWQIYTPNVQFKQNFFMGGGHNAPIPPTIPYLYSWAPSEIFVGRAIPKMAPHKDKKKTHGEKSSKKAPTL